jgi:predicted nucleotidyltransferase
MRNTSSRPAGATYLNRDERIERLREAARRCSERIPSVRRIVLFGSLAAGVPTPRSDADLMIEVASSPHAEPRDRIPEMLRALSPLPCPIDLFVLTSSEVERHGRERSPLLGEILAHGIDLLE